MGLQHQLSDIAARFAFERESTVPRPAGLISDHHAPVAAALTDDLTRAGDPETASLAETVLSHDNYLVTDCAGSIVEASIATQRFFGLSEGHLKQSCLQEYITNQQQGFVLTEDLTNLQHGGTFAVTVEVLTAARGRRLAVLSGIKITGLSSGERIIWAIRDVTEDEKGGDEVTESQSGLEELIEQRTAHLRRKLDQLEYYNHQKDEFLGLVSHELRSPLTIILGNAQVLKNHLAELDVNEREAALLDVVEGAERLQRMIDNLMTLARVHAEEVELEPLLLQHVIPEQITRISSHLNFSEISLDMDENLPPVRGVPTYIEQVLQNLISNAMKYAHGSPINVTVKAQGEVVCISVSDQGSGISPEETQHLFDAFFRGSGNTAVPGAGIGLTVCKRLVEVQGGSIWVESIRGEGTTFRFTLRIDASEES